MKYSGIYLLGGVLLIAVASLFQSCYYDNYEELNPAFGTTTCDTNRTISFSTQVQPIMTGYCGSSGSQASDCHGSSSSSGWPLVTYDDVKASADVSLMDAVRHVNGASPMPKNGGSLDDCSIAILQKWIDQGKLDN